MGDAWVGVVGALAGAVAGGAIGVIGTLLSQRQAQNHENKHRFTADRRVLYGRLLKVCDELVDALTKRTREGPFPIDRWLFPAEAITEVRLIIGEITVTASDAVGRASSDILAAIAGLTDASAALTHSPHDFELEQDPKSKEWLRALATFQKARVTFIDTARAELGV